VNQQAATTVTDGGGTIVNNKNHYDIEKFLGILELWVISFFSHAVILLLFFVSFDQDFDETDTGAKHQGHHSNGNDAKLAATKNAHSTIRGTCQLNY
jgi:hypothetical protein